MGRFGVFGTIAAVAVLAGAPLVAEAGGPRATKMVDANGNAFTGGLSFDPKDTTVNVGDTVRWKNTDSFVPHTATEAHGLWDLGGSYGGTPANPPGFGPGETVGRQFSAGTFNYFCRVHPDDMKGTVSVPVELSEKPRLHGFRPAARFHVIAVWSQTQLPEGQVFDVQKRKGAKPWKTVREGTRKLRGRFAARKGQKLFFRALVREADDPGAASDYSPQAKIKVG